MPKNKEIRKQNYHDLRNAGFNSSEANRYKERSQGLVKELIEARKTFNCKVSVMTGGKK